MENTTNEHIVSQGEKKLSENGKPILFETGYWAQVTELSTEIKDKVNDDTDTILMLWGAFWYFINGVTLNSGGKLSCLIPNDSKLPENIPTIQDILDEISFNQETGESNVTEFKIKGQDKLSLEEKVRNLVKYLMSLTKPELYSDVQILVPRIINVDGKNCKPSWCIGAIADYNDKNEEEITSILDIGTGKSSEVDTMGTPLFSIENDNLDDKITGIPKFFKDKGAKIAFGTAYWRNHDNEAKKLTTNFNQHGITFTVLSQEKEAIYGTKSMAIFFIKDRKARDKHIPKNIYSCELGRGSGQGAFFKYE